MKRSNLLSAFVGLIGVVLIIISITEVIGRSRQAMVEQVQIGELLAAGERSAALAQAIQEAEDRLVVSAGYLPVRDAITEGRGADLQPLVQQASSAPGVVASLVTNATGNELAGVGDTTNLRPSNVPAFETSSDLRHATVTLTATVQVGTEAVGYLIEKYDVRELAPQFARPVAYVGGAVSLVSGKGEVLLSTAEGATRQVQNPALLHALARGDEHATVYDSAVINAKRVAAISPVGGTPYLTLVGADYDAVSGPATELAWELTIMLLLGIIGVGILGALVLGLIVRGRHRIELERHQARSLALTDPLTKLANRRAFDEALSAAQREGGTVGVAIVDLDYLKAINDRGGHSAGDEALQLAGAALQRAVRPQDLAARIGGDEFALILPGATDEQAERIAERARAAIASQILEGHGPLSASIGTATGRSEDVTELIASADDHLYRIKRDRTSRPTTDDRLRSIIERHGLRRRSQGANEAVNDSEELRGLD